MIDHDRPHTISGATNAYRHQRVFNCGLCGSPRLFPVLDLGIQPLAEDMRIDAPCYPLALVRCASCELIQLDYRVDQRLVFPDDHTYATGNTKALRDHFEALAKELERDYLSDGDVAVDIGCNDGTLLSYYSAGITAVGVEPTDQGKKSQNAAVYQAFFTAKLAARILEERGPAKVITATNVLAHCPDPHDFLEGIGILLAPDGIFVTENHDVERVLVGQIDTVYHEHLRYYGSATLRLLLERHGLRVHRTLRIETHGGSFRTYAGARSIPQARGISLVDGLQDRSEMAATKLHAEVQRASIAGPVFGVGATTRATPLIHFARLNSLLAGVYEIKGSDKIGKVMPGTTIPVIDEAMMFGPDQPPTVVLFSWHLAAQLIPKLRQKGYRGHIIVPLPTPHFA